MAGRSTRPSCILSFDGPKGTGKTTLIEALSGNLSRTSNADVLTLCEKDLDPGRAETVALLQQFAKSPTLGLETTIAQRLAAGRQWISRQVLDRLTAGQIALIDRWYPSDAAFRRLLPFETILEINRRAGVSEPDLLVAVTCAAELSWKRATDRARGLSSNIIRSLEQQEACTHAFDVASRKHGWFACRNDGTVAQSVAHILRGMKGAGLL